MKLPRLLFQDRRGCLSLSFWGHLTPYFSFERLAALVTVAVDQV
jgi:hypothetical protein